MLVLCSPQGLQRRKTQVSLGGVGGLHPQLVQRKSNTSTPESELQRSHRPPPPPGDGGTCFNGIKF